MKLSRIHFLYDKFVSEAAIKYQLDPALIFGIIKQESNGNPNAMSHCGARGLMQLMPNTAKWMGVTNSYDARQNIMGGCKYLKRLLDLFDGNVTLALAGYNAGEGNVKKYGYTVPPFKETREYIPKVLKYSEQYRNFLLEHERKKVPDIVEKKDKFWRKLSHWWFVTNKRR